jgi:hypothetical protein
MTYKAMKKEKHRTTIPSSFHHHDCGMGLLVVVVEPPEKDETVQK